MKRGRAATNRYGNPTELVHEVHLVQAICNRLQRIAAAFMTSAIATCLPCPTEAESPV